MEVIVRNLQDQTSEAQLRKYFKPILERLGIVVFHLQKLKAKGCAIVTIYDAVKGDKFLALHGQKEGGFKAYVLVRDKLRHMNRPVYCCRSRNNPDHFLVEGLRKEESDIAVALQRRATRIPQLDGAVYEVRERAFNVTSLQVGQWTYTKRILQFASSYTKVVPGRLVFGSKMIFVTLSVPHPGSGCQLEIPHDTILTTAVWANPPALTFSLSEAPKLYHDLKPSLEDQLQRLVLQGHVQTFKRKRVSALDPRHATIVGQALCYKFQLPSQSDVRAIQALSKRRDVPNVTSWNIGSFNDTLYTGQVSDLNKLLADSLSENVPFEVVFQLQRLHQNSFLRPATIMGLTPTILGQVKRKGGTLVASAIRHMSEMIPYAAPDVDPIDLSTQTLLEMFHKSLTSVFENDPYATYLASDYEHITMVHKATVTPTRITLSGPRPEIKNRVLRKYSAFTDHFLSVSLRDENGDNIRFDRLTDGKDIFHGRFRKVLEGIINIAGRPFESLGHSHSSLREHTLWFMAPFIYKGQLTHARAVVKDLGNFSKIRSPAKCAARIGQAFSQTLSAISVSPTAFVQIPDIERNGRTFSDGVGTCSEVVLKKIWDGYEEGRRYKLKPTIFQIRYQGAKGVISLDKRLEGEQLRLRPSMIKFEGSPDMNIEICGSARKPLPMYLNRQTIKILEDLGVPFEPFQQLQRHAVNQLRMTTLSPINASTFLDRNRVSPAAQLPWLIRKLESMGLRFNDDDFLSNTLELAVLVQLNEIKYKSRIFVDEGWTLYGIMDETGYLKENEIYCAVQTDRGMQTLTGSIVITRCPALHPGDIQCVTAVDAPVDSPLLALHNMVVFSSHGTRDLPSQLSGGDLDGDLYNVIWDQRLYPRKLHIPADYTTPPPIDIGRPVERSDIMDFFVTFMENDNLGLIATLHLILADQNNLGTLDPECIKLAGFHSTAVDFSKSGIPVNRLQLPRYPKARPDFLAPGPHVLIEKGIQIEDLDLIETPDESDEVDEVDSYGPKKIIYYESANTLGKLYRDIDEALFFNQLHAPSQRTSVEGMSVLEAVWKYVQSKTALIQWRHYLDFARSVKENYEDLLSDTIDSFSPRPAHPITELEVFAGSILGWRGAQSKRQRELSKEMKEQFDRNVKYIVNWIKVGDGQDEEGALERSIACLFVGVAETETVRKRRTVKGDMKSWAWIAAGVCLREVERFTGSI